MRGTVLAFCVLPVFSGCVRVEYLKYRGPQNWPTGGAFIQLVEGIEVYEGLPTRPYEVIGLIDIYDGDPFENSQARDEVMELVDTKDADALLWLSARRVASGGLEMPDYAQAAAQVDAGRSTQPEVVITQVSQYVARQTRRALRSSLLLIKWKAGV